MNVSVQRDRVLIEPIVNEAKTEGGILFTHTGEEKTNEAMVIQVGPGRTTEEGIVIPVDVRAGDKIMYDTNSGVKVKLDGKEYVMIKEENIFCVVED